MYRIHLSNLLVYMNKRHVLAEFSITFKGFFYKNIVYNFMLTFMNFLNYVSDGIFLISISSLDEYINKSNRATGKETLRLNLTYLL